MRLLLIGLNDRQIGSNAIDILARLSTAKGFEISATRRIVQYPGALDGLVKLLQEKGNPPPQRYNVAFVLNNLTYKLDEEMTLKIINTPGILDELVKALSKHDDHGLQERVAMVLANLATRHREAQLKILNFPHAMELLVKSLSENDNRRLQRHAVRAINNIGIGMLFNNGAPEGVQASRLKLSATSGLMDGLLSLLAEPIPSDEPILSDIQKIAATALTIIYPTNANEVHLYSAMAYCGRSYGRIAFELYEEALADLDKANDIQPNDDKILSLRPYVKAKLGDYQGALVDANDVIEIERTPFHLQERGVLKRMMGDLVGALADLDEGLNMKTDDYERLKHRGYVKFLMNDEAGAVADAESALRVFRTLEPSYFNDIDYGMCLGTNSVAYMDYNLR